MCISIYIYIYIYKYIDIYIYIWQFLICCFARGIRFQIHIFNKVQDFFNLGPIWGPPPCGGPRGPGGEGGPGGAWEGGLGQPRGPQMSPGTLGVDPKSKKN